MRYIKHDDPPSGFRLLTGDTTLREGDLVWSPVEGEWMKASTFEVVGDSASSLWGAARQD